MKIVPDIVQMKLQEYIMNRCNHAEEGWEFSNQDEDTITGDFLGNLRTKGWIESENLSFRFNYNKFRGRGNNALEKKTGADGIVTIEIERNNFIEYKSFVFQAKKVGNNSSKVQEKKMNDLLPNGNVVFRYGPKGYKVEKYKEDLSICEFISSVFLKCKFGIEGLRYDSNKNTLNKGKLIFKDSEWVNELEIKVKM